MPENTPGDRRRRTSSRSTPAAGAAPPSGPSTDSASPCPPGRVFGLLGPNGAGKSTTTKILTTLSRADRAARRGSPGTTSPREADAVRAAIGYVSQGSSTDPLLTARENLEIAARLRGHRRRRRPRARRAGCSTSSAWPRHPVARVSTFSGGMRRRLDVAAALVHRPQVLFLDEPTTGLDPEARAAMWAEIRRLSGEEALTVVLTTHYMEEADRLADELLIVERRARRRPGHARRAEGRAARRLACASRSSSPTRSPSARAVAGVAGLRDVVVEASGVDGVLAARTDDASAAVGAVIAALDAAGIRFGQVAASHPTLDDVYLHFVGHTFGDADARRPSSRQEQQHDRPHPRRPRDRRRPLRAGWFTQTGQVLRRWLISTWRQAWGPVMSLVQPVIWILLFGVGVLVARRAAAVRRRRATSTTWCPAS